VNQVIYNFIHSCQLNAKMKFKLNLYLRSSYINLEDFSILDQKQLYKIIKCKIKNMKKIKKENHYFIMKILKE